MATVGLERIARRAGVSTAAVSLVLNRKTNVAIAEATKTRIIKAAKDLGYQRLGIARAVLSPLRHVAIAVGDIHVAHETFTASIFEGVQSQLNQRGYQALYYLIDSPAVHVDGAKQIMLAAADKIIESAHSRLVDGLILDKQFFLDASVHRLTRASIRLVMVNGGLKYDENGLPIPSVTIDDLKAGQMATAHLLELRHRRIALLGRPFRQGPRAYESSPVANFQLGYQQALTDARIAPNPDWQVEADMLDRDATYRAVERVMNLPDRPTALVCGEDQIAGMAINALRRMGHRVPEDVSVMGCGNLAMVERLMDPGLSTVGMPLEENGQRAATMLVDLIEGRQVARKQVVLNPELIIRQSTSVNSEAV